MNADDNRLVKIAEKTPEPARLTRALRVELRKPLGEHSWDTMGPLLRAQRSVVYRLLNASILACAEYANRSRRGEPVGIFRTTKKNPELRDGIPNPSTAAYREVERELSEIREWAKKKLAGKPGDQRATLDMIAELEFTGASRSVMGQMAFSRFKVWDKGDPKRSIPPRGTQLPTFGKGAPIPLRADEVHLGLDASGRAVLSLTHAPGLRCEWALAAGKGSQWSRLRALASGHAGLSLGDAKLKYDERQKKWFAFLAYSEPKPEIPSACDPDHVMVLHRGQRNLIVAMTNTGHWRVIARGNKLREAKRRFKARRDSERGITVAERGKGARGHGRERRFTTRDELERREKAWIKTYLQGIGSRVEKLALEWGCGTVLIEDYGGIAPDEDRARRRFMERFPNHDLKQCVTWSLAKAGLTLGEYPAAFISQTCPACGNQDARQHNIRTGIFHCSVPECGFDRGVDMVAAVHALRRACGGSAGEWDRRWQAERKLAEDLLGKNPKEDKDE